MNMFFKHLYDDPLVHNYGLKELSNDTIWRISTDLALVLSNHEDKKSEAFAFWLQLRDVIEEQITLRFTDKPIIHEWEDKEDEHYDFN